MQPTGLQEQRLHLLLDDATPAAKPSANADPSTAAPPPAASTPAHTRPSLPALTGLRAVLMLHVLVRNMRSVAAVDTFSWMVNGGAVGVSTFFCLSGFILAYCYGDHRFDSWRCYGSFIGRRYARLFPIYVISQLMSLGSEVSAVKQYGMDAWTVLHWLALATGTHLWFPWPEYAPSTNPGSRGYFMLNPTLWALSVVLFFYASMPLLMRAGRWFVGVDRLSELPRGKSTSRLLWLCVLCSAWIWLPLGIVPVRGWLRGHGIIQQTTDGARSTDVLTAMQSMPRLGLYVPLASVEAAVHTCCTSLLLYCSSCWLVGCLTRVTAAPASLIRARSTRCATQHPSIHPSVL